MFSISTSTPWDLFSHLFICKVKRPVNYICKITLSNPWFMTSFVTFFPKSWIPFGCRAVKQALQISQHILVGSQEPCRALLIHGSWKSSEPGKKQSHSWGFRGLCLFGWCFVFLLICAHSFPISR